MGSWEHPRQRIFNSGQHPYRHAPSELVFTHAGFPGVTNVEDALTWIFNVLYPQYIGTFATVADLPVAPAANSYAVVSDDGDGKSAGYIYQAVDGNPGWAKRYDVDWSLENILSETVQKTQALYVFKYGSSDKDADGNVLSGDNGGQHLYGGDNPGQNLVLHANSGDADAVAADQTGSIIAADPVRPLTDANRDLGEFLFRWGTVYAYSLNAKTSIATDGGVTAGGSIAATGTVTGSNLSGTNTGDLTLASFGSTPAAAGASISGQVLTLQPADATHGGGVSITSQTFAGTKTFTDSIVVGTGLTVSAGGATITGTVGITGSISATNLSGTNSGDITLAAIGSAPASAGASLSGQVLTLQPADATHGGVLTASTQTIAGAKTLTGVLTLSSAGTALSVTNDATVGGDLTVTGSVKNGSASFLGSELMSLRNVKFRDAGRSIAVQNGDNLTYDSTSGTWLASAPASSIDHTSLSNLTTGDAGHTQFVMLTGRSGGQAVQGGTAASENLTLESTAHATKGTIKIKDSLVANTDASYSSSWSGVDLGDGTHYLRHLYTKGEAFGLRLENLTTSTLPAAAASTKGHLVWNGDENQIYGDSGSGMVRVGVRRFMSDTSWNGSITTLTVTVSSTITDARMAIWQLCDNANNYERLFVKITAISATQVKIDVELALPSGSYRLIGLE